MTVSVKEHLNHVTSQEQIELQRMFRAVVADNAAMRAALLTFTAKIDTDFTAQNAAVAASQLDVNYAATVDPVAPELIS